MAARKYTLAQRLRDPNKRRLLPITALSPVQQRERRRLQGVARDDANPLFDASASLGGHRLKAAAQGIVDALYSPQESALDRQAASAQAQGTAVAQRATGYQASADDRAALAMAREQALTDRLNASLAQIGQRTQGAVSQAGADAQARLAADAGLRGGGLDGGANEQVQAEIAATQGRLAGDAQAFQSAGAEQGANYEGLLAATRASALLHGQETQRRLATGLDNDLADIRAKRADLAGQRGNEFTKQLLGLRQQEFENRAVAQEYGLKRQGAAADLAKARAQVALASQRQAETERNNRANRRLSAGRLSETQRADRERERLAQERLDKPPAKRSTPEPAESRKLRVGIVNATEDFKSLLSARDKNGRPRTPQRVEQILHGRKAPPIVIRAASELGQYGYVRPETLRALQQAGVRVPAGWRRPKGASTYKSPSSPG